MRKTPASPSCELCMQVCEILALQKAYGPQGMENHFSGDLNSSTVDHHWADQA